ncbi:hypothetical protein Egran_02729 [Elaphomyces granulatus]|uniref:Alpha/beta hydrolase fold-3 domain-containing protein n=1 Tax=Elaphomyces granulatus TaxID=519963 RepID=A0A232LZG5_9EURO|nr:hypothetical protein Egran_02729 [Elaphomyces granulatus]
MANNQATIKQPPPPPPPQEQQQQLERGYPPNLSFWEKADLVPALVSIAAITGYYAVRGLFEGTKHYWDYVGHAALRNIAGRLSCRQCQFSEKTYRDAARWSNLLESCLVPILTAFRYLFPSTDKAYEQFAKEKGFQPESVPLRHGGQGHWLGRKDAKYVLIFFHGGGFQYPAVNPHLEFVLEVIKNLNATGHDVSAFFPSYTLTPYASYPTQLRQAAEALRYILADTGRPPSNVFIAGDSAGANLALAVLSHLSHPHPEIDPIEVVEPLAGIAVIGPFVTFDLNLPSEKQHRHTDVVDTKSTVRSGEVYLNGRKGDNWSEQRRTTADWWKGSKVKHALITAGANEVLLSSILDFEQKFKTAVPNTVFILAHDECHVSPVYDKMIGDKTEKEQEKAFKSWLAERLV